jgi:hypothetical protein
MSVCPSFYPAVKGGGAGEVGRTYRRIQFLLAGRAERKEGRAVDANGKNICEGERSYGLPAGHHQSTTTGKA